MNKLTNEQIRQAFEASWPGSFHTEDLGRVNADCQAGVPFVLKSTAEEFYTFRSKKDDGGSKSTVYYLPKGDYDIQLRSLGSSSFDESKIYFVFELVGLQFGSQETYIDEVDKEISRIQNRLTGYNLTLSTPLYIYLTFEEVSTIPDFYDYLHNAFSKTIDGYHEEHFKKISLMKKQEQEEEMFEHLQGNIEDSW